MPKFYGVFFDQSKNGCQDAASQIERIPVITYDSDFNAPTLEKHKDLRLAYIGTDNLSLVGL